ncbi:hypothetical protein [Campylobacter mucosalis]|uniref:Uncharacterized protein n=1 Tax=Campylobacter mucosalis CCUG 21559 TaxID=1032067 RepID=A0A6G5QFS9_9BACT|nr:hypothetical protein [Campylobacter mucosalis]QCD44474.1 hypothetical protein CMUC_0675 [Campylobacter mucosalis CCUG 21559]
MQLITIDNYIFSIENNITSLQKALSVNYEKQQTITKPVYTHLGGYEEVISFNAKILLNDQAKFSGFEELIKEARPLKISAFDLVQSRYILINSLTQELENFTKIRFNGMWYYSKSLSINGYII